MRQNFRQRLKMMAVISRTDFIQGEFAFKTKKILAHRKLTKHRLRKLFLFLRHREIEYLWLLNSLNRGQKSVNKRFANQGRKSERLSL